MELGVKEIYGFDGDYVPRNLLMISQDCFEPWDLSTVVPCKKKYDLAISMEVAEHLPESASDVFVDNICNHADTVLFSAAHPGQGGDNHINEQPIEYWVEKFEKHGYNKIEIKKYFKNDNKIELWYRENMILFVKNDRDILRNRLEQIFL